jgi:hypothetical protein
VEDVVALLPVLVMLAAVVTVACGAVAARRSPPSREQAVAAGRAHATRTAVAAVGVGAAAALYVGATQLGNSEPGGLGVTALLVPLSFGIAHTLVLGIGELTWPRPDGAVRRARLVHRGLLDAAPRRLVRAAAGTAALTVVTLLGGALLADASGRGVAIGTATASPFPGSFYGLPAAAGIVALAVVAAAVLWIVANRPAVATEDDATETALRNAAAHRVLRVAVGVPLFVTGGLLFVGGNALHSVASNSAGSAVLDAGGLPAAVLGMVAMLAGVVACCLPAPSVPADAPAVPAG